MMVKHGLAGQTHGATSRIKLAFNPQGMRDGEDNHCVTIHEFVHMIDFVTDPFVHLHFDSSSVLREYEGIFKL